MEARLRELHLKEKSMSKNGDADQRQDDSSQDTGNPQDRGALINSSASETRYPPPPPKQSNGAQNAKPTPWWRRMSTWNFIVEILLFLVGIYVACTYHGQLNEMVESNKLTAKRWNPFNEPLLLLRP
jgi:hypothetical protein